MRLSARDPYTSRVWQIETRLIASMLRVSIEDALLLEMVFYFSSISAAIFFISRFLVLNSLILED